MSALLLLADYFIQISVIQPSLLRGELEGIALISQYNPHGIFIALEELGYILMSVAFLFMAPVFFRNRLEKAVRYIFTANFALTLIAFIVFSVLYGTNREYRFEIAVIAISWLTLISSGILLSMIFRRSGQFQKIGSEATSSETVQKNRC
jgi:quinol-cytochrome oxidoreductase complex cytochrome b subunit